MARTMGASRRGATGSRLGGLLALAMGLVVLLGCPGVARAADPAHNVSYVGSDGLTYTADEALVLTPDHTDWVGLPLDVPDPSGEAEPETFYYVQDDVTISGAITVTHNINLILGDGATLTIENGINVNSANDATLQIFPQPLGTGRILGPANGTAGQAGIGSGRNQEAGAVTIVGGVIDVTGGAGAAGLGGGAGSIAVMDILGGTITARGGESAEGHGGGAGIGNGGNTTTPLADIGNLTLQPSAGISLTVNASGAAGAAGIGGGAGNTMHVILDRCTVNAAAGAGAAAIGGGEGAIGSVTVEDATVTAISSSGVAIGSGNNAGAPQGTLTEQVSIVGNAQVAAMGSLAGVGSSPQISESGELTGFSTAGGVLVGGNRDSQLLLDAAALSSRPLVRALAGTIVADNHFAAFGGHTVEPPTEVIAILGGPAPDWASYSHVRFQPVELTKVSISPAHATCEPQKPIQFSVLGEASDPLSLPATQDLASVLGVTWSLSGNSDPATAIDASGVFVAGPNETSKDITVTATLGPDVTIHWPDLQTALTAEVGDVGSSGSGAGAGSGQPGSGSGTGNQAGTGSQSGTTTRPTTSTTTTTSTTRPSSTSTTSTTSNTSRTTSSSSPSSRSSSTSSGSKSSASSSSLPKTEDLRLTTCGNVALASLVIGCAGLALLGPAGQLPASREVPVGRATHFRPEGCRGRWRASGRD